MRVRAIVGISGNATHPDALDKLHEIADDNLMIVPKDDPLFHPKLYLFYGSGAMTRRAWVGSANFTKRGFSDAPTANEEMMLEVGDDQADALATWFEEQRSRFKERWDRCPKNTREVIEKYRKDWKPPHRDVRELVSGPVTSRVDLLLEDRPSTFDQYHHALKACDEMLRDENREWGAQSKSVELLGSDFWPPGSAARRIALVGSRTPVTTAAPRLPRQDSVSKLRF